jgi:hypothetical protein
MNKFKYFFRFREIFRDFDPFGKSGFSTNPRGPFAESGYGFDAAQEAAGFINK